MRATFLVNEIWFLEAAHFLVSTDVHFVKILFSPVPFKTHGSDAMSPGVHQRQYVLAQRRAEHWV